MGCEGVFRDFEDVWGNDFQIEPEVYFDLGEQTLLFYVLHGRGKQSGADVALPTAVVARWRDDGLCVYFKAYADREDALRDLGVWRMPSNQSLLTTDRPVGARRSPRLLTLRDTGATDVAGVRRHHPPHICRDERWQCEPRY